MALAGCLSSQSSTSDPLEGERQSLSEKECEEQDGIVVGDPGDGSTHRADYVCSSGKPPLASIRQREEEPFYIEGAVCCPR
jgi:hypothetical protein